MKKKMTLLALEKDFSGKIREIIALANSLVDLYNVEIFFLNSSNDSIIINSKIKVSIYNPQVLECRKFYTDLFKDSDVVISTDEEFSKYVIKYAKCKTILWAHKERNFVKDKLLSKYDLIVVPNKYLKNHYLGCNDNVIIINDAIELPKDKKLASGDNLIFIGRLTKDKKLENLIDIFAKVQKEIKTNLIIIGVGEERKNLEDYLKKSKIPNVYFKGLLNKSEMENELLESALYVTCAEKDTSNLSMLEAMSYGVPVVAFSDILDDTSFIVDDINGYLIENRDEDIMYERIKTVLTDREKRENLSLCAKEKSLEFDIYSLKIEWIKIL